MSEEYPDDRVWSTDFGDGCKLDGVHGVEEFQVAADLCQDYGFEMPAAVLRAVHANVRFEEPKRPNGWSRSDRSNVHFFLQGNRTTICNREIWMVYRDLTWYPMYGELCKNCLRILLAMPEKHPGPHAALVRTLAERDEMKRNNITERGLLELARAANR